MIKILEKDIKDQMMDWLAYQKKTFVWIQNQGSYYTGEGRSRHGFKATSVSGVSDILGVWQGYPLAIEVKRPKEKPTQLQTEFLDNFARAGGIAICAHSLEELQRSLKQVMQLAAPFEGIYIRNL